MIQAREGLSEEKLSEYKDIFSFFDRSQEQIIAQITRSCFSTKLSVFRDGGGTITTVELGQVSEECQPLLGDFEKLDFWKLKVMRTFGWAPTEGELQELVGEIDQVQRRRNN